MFHMYYSPRLLWLPALIIFSWFLASEDASAGSGDSVLPERTVAKLTPPAVIVIGFVGGYVHHNDSVHQEVQLANHLSKDYPSGVEVRIFENHSGRQAYQEIQRFLDSDHDGALSAEEKRKARIVLYGHSWGASEAVTLARSLQKDSVDVLLTIQVDSVSKMGKDDKLIPANVAQAVNFYQIDGLLHGQRQIVAADPSHTQILGNFQLDYKTNHVNCDGYPWFARMFMRPHIEIESDPKVWNQVESLIRSKLPSATIIGQ